MANTSLIDATVSCYLDDLLYDGTLEDNHNITDDVDAWNEVLREAVARRSPRPTTTLRDGMALIPVAAIGVGNPHQRYSQWLCLQTIASALPGGRLRREVLLAARLCGVYRQEI